MDELNLGIYGFSWEDLHSPLGLKRLFGVFQEDLERQNSDLFARYAAYIDGDHLTPVEESELLVAVAPFVSAFIARLFSVTGELQKLRDQDLSLQPVYLFKRDFVHRRVLKKYKSAGDVKSFEEVAFQKIVNDTVQDKKMAIFPEETLAKFVVPLLEEEKKIKTDQAQASRLQEIQSVLEPIEKWVATLFYSENHKDWASFVVPEKIEFDSLVRFQRSDADMPDKLEGPKESYRRRDGFQLTDRRMSQKLALGEVKYCIYCHSREKDSCSKGLYDKKKNKLQKNPIGIPLTGCPLDEKISEAHILRNQGDSLAALATIVIDNPMCPGTGHRICNDCMKSCIFQKQEPVNIPQIETNILTQVLSLPYGFEMYSLLTRWNPLNRKRPYLLPYNGKNILVVGMGPAGYTLAHYLLNEGFGVVGIDGLKIEPLSKNLVGSGFKPICDIATITDELEKRILAGFGGVAEYGITVRWDKNFLKMIYLTMARRDKFSVYGGVRFGGTIAIEDAWELGFDHIAMATGAGKPTIVKMKNNLIRGVRKASDFLMALQLTGAFKKDNFANLQIRLPAIVIGGGLTAIDTATEIMAYYPIQVEKILDRYEVLEAKFGKDRILERAFDEDKEVFEEFLAHGREVRAERARAKEAGENPNYIKLIRNWGGVNLVYRKTIADSPAYRLNHEEIIKAFEEGIYFTEKHSPVECHRGQHGSIDGMTFEKQFLNQEGKWRGTGEFIKLPAKSVCVAAGTSPNIIYEREKPGTFNLNDWGYFFKKYRDDKDALIEAEDESDAFMTSYDKYERRISFYGDNHPNFAGNVVKAMASAKIGYPKIISLFEDHLAEMRQEDQGQREQAYQKFQARLDQELLAEVVDVIRLTPTIIEVIVKAPLAARNFHPGQFYRLQNYESSAVRINGTKLITEGIALTGAWNDPDKGLLSLIILEMGTSSRICSTFQKGQRVVVMGPTGAPTEIPTDETVLLAGGGLGNAVLFSIGSAMEKAGCRVIYFAGYKDGRDVFKQDEIEEGTDVVVWSNDTGDSIKPRRPQDKSFQGNIVQALVAYGEGKLGQVPIPLNEVDRIIAIGSDRMMAAVKAARFTVLKPILKEDHIAIGSINSSMQCMMKEVCAQCLQKHVDPKTGEETHPVFSCFNQDQMLDKVDFQNLNERLQMNHLQEILSNAWLDHLFMQQDVPRV